VLPKFSPYRAEVPKKLNVDEETVEPNATIKTCLPIEAKGILGSDKRKYLLDIGRLSPRDANWVPESKGGTGNFEAARKSNASTTTAIPLSLEDDEWTMNVLRPELIGRFTQVAMMKYMKAKVTAENDEKDDAAEEAKGELGTKSEESQNQGVSDGKVDDTKKGVDKKGVLTEEDKTYMKSFKLNINVFLPNMKSFVGVDDEAADQMKRDEQTAREAATFLWDEVLPNITQAVKDGTIQQIPVDGKTATEFLHRNGVNCRYLGRLALLAKEEEAKDEKTEADLSKGRLTVIERRTTPKCWLELLECEMVARAAKHVLDGYLTEHGGVSAMQPAQTVAAFLSALVSDCDETAAQTEARIGKRSEGEPDDEDLSALTIWDTGGDGDAVACSIRSRYEVWQDIELQVGRRFRYSLSLYNTGNKSGRALYIPLLRRVCQRTGVRLVARNYDVGGKCCCGNVQGGRLAESFPISPLDVCDMVPLMKHAAAYQEGFLPCSVSPSLTIPALQVSLRDARVALERAHIQTGERVLNLGLELAQEAASLYERVTESQAHPGVIDSFELMASIFAEAGEGVGANCTKRRLRLGQRVYFAHDSFPDVPLYPRARSCCEASPCSDLHSRDHGGAAAYRKLHCFPQAGKCLLERGIQRRIPRHCDEIFRRGCQARFM
jgi:protein TIF31